MVSPRTGSSFRHHIQDLTEDSNTLTGGVLRHGRASLTHYPKGGEHREGHSVGAEWFFFGESSTALYYHHDPTGDHKHMVHAAVKRVFSVFLHWSPPWKPMKDGERLDPRSIDVSIHDGAIFWTVWKDPHSWSRSDGWRNSSFNWVNWLLGKTVHESTPIQEVETVVPMPEGRYPVKVTISEDTWTRPRSVFGWGEARLRRANVEVLDWDGKRNSIPYPGKGESSYDCGEEGSSALSCPANTVAEAIGTMVESVMRSRERYGGSVNWVPTPPYRCL